MGGGGALHPHPMLDHDVFDGFNCSHFPLGLVEPGGQTHRLIQREGGAKPRGSERELFVT